MHWYTQQQFEELATSVGLAVTAVTDADGKPAPADGTDVLHFRLLAT
ncbi:hypothetical protein [Streptomyces sp. NPDC058145]